MRKKMFIRTFHLDFIKQDFLPVSHQADRRLVVYIEEERLDRLIPCEAFLHLVHRRASRPSSQITLLLRKAGIPLFAWCPTRLNMCHAISSGRFF